MPAEPIKPIKVPLQALKPDLNSDLWDGDRLRPQVKQALLKIARDFVEHLGVVDWDELEDVIFTGSMANYNWTSGSDVDLHPVIDFSAVDEDVNLVAELMDAKRKAWADSRNVSLFGHPVEAYPQNAAEPHYSTGIYSILRDEWIRRPSRVRPVVDVKSAEAKAKRVARAIADAVADPDCSTECLDGLRDKIKRMRQCGLESGGEFSVENLAFKALRKSGHVGMLLDAIAARRNDELSLDAEG